MLFGNDFGTMSWPKFTRNMDLTTTALLLVRLSKDLSRFPLHKASILASSVISCQKAGLRKSALELAMMEIRPENRSPVPKEHRKKIENLIRRPDKSACDRDPICVPCTYCGVLDDEMNLHCRNCQAELPFCCASGKSASFL